MIKVPKMPVAPPLSVFTRKFDGQLIRDIIYGDADGKLVDTMDDQSRWSVWHTLTFDHDGKTWRINYETAATEHQEVDWPREFDAVEVEAYEVTVTKYRKKAA